MHTLRKRGRVWHARIRVAGRPPFERSTRCAKKADAAILAERWDREAALQGDQVALEDALTLYDEKLQRKGAAKGTRERFALSAGHLLGFFGCEREIDTIRLHDTTAYMDHRRRSRQVQDKRGFERTMPPASDRTIAIELGHLQATLQRCLELEMYSRPPKSIWPPELSKTSRKCTRHLTDREYQRLLPEMGATTGYYREQGHGAGRKGGAEQRRQWVEHEAPMGADWSEHLAVSVFTGVRAGELYELAPEDLQDGHVWVNGYKTPRAARWVPVHPEIAGILNRRAAAAPPGGRLFPMTTESKSDERTRLKAQERAFLRALHRGCDRAGIPRTSCNDLRRTFASWCRQDGVPEADVIEWMGHTTSRMVREVYAQTSREHGTRQMGLLRARQSAAHMPARRQG